MRFEAVPVIDGEAAGLAALGRQRIDIVISLALPPVPESLGGRARLGTLVPLLGGHRDARRAVHRPLAFLAGNRAMTIAVHRAGKRGIAGPALAEACVRSTASARLEAVDDALFNVVPLLLARACSTTLTAAPAVTQRPITRDGTRLRGLVVRVMLGMRAVMVERLAAFIALPQWNVGVVGDPIHRFLEDDYVPQIAWLPRAPRVASSRIRFHSHPMSAVGSSSPTTSSLVGASSPQSTVRESTSPLAQ